MLSLGQAFTGETLAGFSGHTGCYHRVPKRVDPRRREDMSELLQRWMIRPWNTVWLANPKLFWSSFLLQALSCSDFFHLLTKDLHVDWISFRYNAVTMPFGCLWLFFVPKWSLTLPRHRWPNLHQLTLGPEVFNDAIWSSAWSSTVPTGVAWLKRDGVLIMASNPLLVIGLFSVFFLEWQFFFGLSGCETWKIAQLQIRHDSTFKILGPFLWMPQWTWHRTRGHCA